MFGGVLFGTIILLDDSGDRAI